MTPSMITLLRQAEQVIQKTGHGRHEYVSSQTERACLLGSLMRAQVDPNCELHGTRLFTALGGAVVHDIAPAVRALQAVLPNRCCGEPRLGRGAIYHFNDQHCRGGDEARSVLREAREKLEADLP